MDEVERDGNITVNVGFGNITFYRDSQGPYAHAIVDLAFGREQRPNAIQVEMRFSCAPDTDSIADVVEESRRHLLELLTSAATTLEAQSAHALLYQKEETVRD